MTLKGNWLASGVPMQVFVSVSLSLSLASSRRRPHPLRDLYLINERFHIELRYPFVKTFVFAC